MKSSLAKACCRLVPLLAFLLWNAGDNILRAQADVPSGPVTLSQPDLQELVAPIALYPDPLIALILPASTVPTDIVLAERFITNGGNADDVGGQNWDDNVKGLAHYPDVLQMMSENLDWTNQLGAAVLYQQNDVMAAIQAQRAKARALGNLNTTPQQQVDADNGVIQIYPADPQIIYVPVYDPEVVYLQPAPPIFGIGFNIGIWIGGGCDWSSHRIYSRGYYRPGYGWRPGYNHGPIWRPNPGRPRPRPPYRPGRPGSHLPGVRPVPNRPGNPGGNRPGKPKPRPGDGGTIPDRGTQPGIKPLPGRPSQPEKPRARPRPVKPPAPKPENPAIQPAPIKPAPQPDRPAIQPAPAKPRPQPERPASRPSPGMPAPHPGNSRPDNPKRPSVRPAPARTQPRPAASAKNSQGHGNSQDKSQR